MIFGLLHTSARPSPPQAATEAEGRPTRLTGGSAPGRGAGPDGLFPRVRQALRSVRRGHPHRPPSPRARIRRLRRGVHHGAARGVPPGSEQVVLLSRGHLPPYLVAEGRVVPLIRTTPGTPLGAGLPGPDDAEPEAFPLPPGASLLLTTDGVTEARDRHGVFHDPATGLAGRSFAEPQELVDTLVAEVTAWTGGRLHDDMAVLAVTRPGPPGSPGA
ncbi:PP2C family protein-serine/threonine phosphatase [Streptomyces sp. NPDC058374]|uniref:PP2C family protein-serine/threonine phosphatase n=1 Tax=Streptomyces sp. NPDC058374 TaxID=3346466 RepID=UPI003664A365